MLELRAVLGHRGQTFLYWNLFLAWLPFAAARTTQVLDRRGWSRPGLLVVGVFWLAFLPNAPYLVTDPVHLAIGSDTPHRLAFDAVSSASWRCSGCCSASPRWRSCTSWSSAASAASSA